MKQTRKTLGLLLLLILTQQGAIAHELGHLLGARRVEVQVGARTGVETACPLCAEFAQVVTPAFSHAFQIPRLVLAEPELAAERAQAAIDAAVPTPRSRGPPSSS